MPSAGTALSNQPTFFFVAGSVLVRVPVREFESVADIEVALWFSLSSEEEYMGALKTGVAATV